MFIKRKSSDFKKVKPYILLPDFLNSEECDSFIASTKDSSQINEEYLEDGKDFHSFVIPFRNHEEKYKKLFYAVESANDSNFNFEDNLCVSQALIVNKYEGSEYTGWHVDGFTSDMVPDYYFRKLTIVVQLSAPEDYEGGDFEMFKYHDLSKEDKELFKRRGSAIIIPSFEWHQVTPITSGTRYSTVLFVEGETPFK